ncbi:MAG: hypothetical protein ABR569_02195 [Gaiellaceae bacterium]
MREPGLSDAIVAGSSRRGFLARAGRLLLAVAGGGFLAAAVKAEAADAYHFCGHVYTTGSCPHPTGLPRVDAHGFPLRASDGKPVDDLGRPVDLAGRPLDEQGQLLRDPDGRSLPPAPRTPVCDAAGERFGFRPYIDGAWYRCCNGHIRKLVDCCAFTRTRINGDAALTGYCSAGRKVFCVQYYDSNVPC